MPLDLVVHKEVKQAIADTAPVVALESTILAHGFPCPENKDVAEAIGKAVREAGAIPATIIINQGQIIVGAPAEMVSDMCLRPESYPKTNIADLGVFIGRNRSGATTVSATVAIASMARIPWVATGGIGGVHRENPHDVSSDLTALQRYRVGVVCSGAKTFLDIPKTVERLETNGIAMVGYDCRKFPGFYQRQTDIDLDQYTTDIDAIVRAKRAQNNIGTSLLVLNPVPRDQAVTPDEVEAALKRLGKNPLRGKKSSPWILKRLGRLPAFLEANKALAVSNAQLAAKLAVAESKKLLTTWD